MTQPHVRERMALCLGALGTIEARAKTHDDPFAAPWKGADAAEVLREVHAACYTTRREGDPYGWTMAPGSAVRRDLAALGAEGKVTRVPQGPGRPTLWRAA